MIPSGMRSCGAVKGNVSPRFTHWAFDQVLTLARELFVDGVRVIQRYWASDLVLTHTRELFFDGVIKLVMYVYREQNCLWRVSTFSYTHNLSLAKLNRGQN